MRMHLIENSSKGLGIIRCEVVHDFPSSKGLPYSRLLDEGSFLETGKAWFKTPCLSRGRSAFIPLGSPLSRPASRPFGYPLERNSNPWFSVGYVRLHTPPFIHVWVYFKSEMQTNLVVLWWYEDGKIALCSRALLLFSRLSIYCLVAIF